MAECIAWAILCALSWIGIYCFISKAVNALENPEEQKEYKIL